MPSKKRLLIFHQSLAPYRVDLWNSLNKVFELTLFFIYENHLDQKFDQNSLKDLLDFEPNYFNKGINIGQRAIRWGFVSIIKRYKPDIVFGYEYSQTTTTLYFLKRLFGFKYNLFTICDDSLKIAETCSGLRRKFRDYLAGKIDGIIFVNQDAADWYSCNFPNLRHKIVFPILTEENRFRKGLVASLPISNQFLHKFNLFGKKTIFYVGRLVDVKGIQRLIDAFNLISVDKEDARLIIIGDGEQKSKLNVQVNELGLNEKVIFTGRYEGLDLFAWYNLGQIFVLPSHYEPFGAVVNEALISGARVLCSSHAGSSSLINDGENGSLFNPYDQDELIELLDRELELINPLADEIVDIRSSNMLCLFGEYFDNLAAGLEKVRQENR